MEDKGLWEDEKKPMVLFEVIEMTSYEYETNVETVLCASLLDAHFEFKERVERVKKEECCWDEDGNLEEGYICEEEKDYFNLYKDGYAAQFEITIWIMKKEVVSNF